MLRRIKFIIAFFSNVSFLDLIQRCVPTSSGGACYIPDTEKKYKQGIEYMCAYDNPVSIWVVLWGFSINRTIV